MSVSMQSTKVLNLIPPAVIKDNASFVEVEIDTAGYEYMTVFVALGATDIAMATLKLQSATASGGSFSDVTGLVYGTSNNTGGSASTLPSANDDDSVFAFDVDLRAQNRFFQLIATAGDGAAGTYLSAIAILSRAHTAPNTAAERGTSQTLRTT
ncbi:MAG: hypothetical protein IID41_03615 [Planctomycetes bacterium]|nr:hypothetical protein [Planctomycetota bacterium]